MLGNMNIEMRQANMADVPALVSILQEAAEFKASQDDNIWGSDPFTAEKVEGMVTDGDTHIASVNGHAAGSVTLPWSDERKWGPGKGNDGRALYIHRMAVNNRFRGRYRVGELMIVWAGAQVLRANREYLRLDCSYDNPRLSAYYERRGFKEVERKDLDNSTGTKNPQIPVYKVALFQKSV